MRTALKFDDHLFEEAVRLTGVKEKTALLHERLNALIQRESARRLSPLGGSEPKLDDIRRRRTSEGYANLDGRPSVSLGPARRRAREGAIIKLTSCN